MDGEVVSLTIKREPPFNEEGNRDDCLSNLSDKTVAERFANFNFLPEHFQGLPLFEWLADQEGMTLSL